MATAILYVRCILLLRIIISNNSVIRYLLYVFLVYVAGNSLSFSSFPHLPIAMRLTLNDTYSNKNEAMLIECTAKQIIKQRREHYGRTAT